MSAATVCANPVLDNSFYNQVVNYFSDSSILTSGNPQNLLALNFNPYGLYNNKIFTDGFLSMPFSRLASLDANTAFNLIYMENKMGNALLNQFGDMSILFFSGLILIYSLNYFRNNKFNDNDIVARKSYSDNMPTYLEESNEKFYTLLHDNYLVGYDIYKLFIIEPMIAQKKKYISVQSNINEATNTYY